MKPHPSAILDRRSLLGGLGASTLVACAPGAEPRAAGRAAPLDRALPDTGEEAEWDTATADPEGCEVTPPAGEGPYYRGGAPARADLRTADEAGITLYMRGVVRSSGDCGPLPDAVVDLWHVMQSGIYDNTSEEMHYRSRVTVGLDGRYEFVTLRPVNYPAGPGSDRMMNAHLHVKITAWGHAPLTTQVLFSDDPYRDPLMPEELHATPVNNSDGSQSIEWDFILEPE